MKVLLGHCLYRRVAIWTMAVIVVMVVTVLHSSLSARSRSVLDLVHGGKTIIKEIPSTDWNTPSHNKEKLNTQPLVQDKVHDISVVVEEGPTNDDGTQHRHHLSYQAEGDNSQEIQKENEGDNDERDTGKPKWLKYKQ
jgi:hypothetical protein